MTEQQPHDLVARYPSFELRRYPAHLIAEVEVESSFTDAGNRAFRTLVSYISGSNSTHRKVAMTAPVVQEQAGMKIAMTAPVVQESGSHSDRYVVGLVMPAAFTLETLPTPTDARVTVREVSTQLAAAKSFRGRWSESIYQEQLASLQEVVVGAGYQIAGPPRFARFDPPWTPWFLRHNEVVLPVEDPLDDRSSTGGASSVTWS